MKAKLLTFAIVLIVIIIGGVIVWQKRDVKTTNPRTSSTTAEPEKKLPGINGIEINEKIAQQRPLAVMIENHPASRPQSGLADADIVYENFSRRRHH